MKKITCIIVMLLCINQIIAQNVLVDSAIVSPQKARCGYDAKLLYSAANARLVSANMSISSLPKSSYPANAIFSCGVFRLYYEDIALATGDGFDDPTDGAARRVLLCAVYQYVESTFDFSSITPGDPITIEIQRSSTAANPPANPAVLAVAGPVYPSAAAPGIYNGSLLNHVLTGSSPNPALFDAVLQVDFLASNTLGPVTYHNFTSLPVPNCMFDLFTVLLHEVGHQLGFGSLLVENSSQQPVSSFGNNQYTRYDWQNLWHGDINVPASFEKIVAGTLASPQINSSIVNPTNYIRDGKLWLNNSGKYLGNLPIYSGVYGTFNSLTLGSVASHMCGDYLSFTERFSASPGYMKPFSMGPFVDNGETRREYTDEEIRIFLNLGYSLNPAFAASTSINGVNSNASIISTNKAPVTTKQVTSRSSGTNAFLTFPDLVQAPDFTISNTGAPLIITLASDATISDANGDQVRVENNSLFNIRGSGNTGNNHNQVTVNAAGTIITFIPRPNFIGRAQFGFYLHDGKERGSFMVYTIDVTNGSAFVNTPNVNTPAGNNELILNGDFEEGTETRLYGNPVDEAKINTSLMINREEGLFFGGDNFADAHPLQYVNWVWTSSKGMIVGQSNKPCSTPVTPIRFGQQQFAFPGAIWNYPIPVTGNRYSYILGNHNYQTLAKPLVTCKRYSLKMDLNFQNTGLPVGSNHTFNVTIHSAVAYPTNPVLQTIPVTVVVGTGWQTITVPFTYCASGAANYLNLNGGSKVNYDNISLIEDLSPVPPLVASISTSTNAICLGSSVNLSATATNTLCSQSFNWMPGSLSGNNITVSPTANTSYTLTVNDGCRTATAVTTITVNPLPVVTAVASPTSVCAANPNSTLTGSGASSYIWNPGSIPGNPITVSPTSTAIYTVTGTDANGCSNTGTVMVTYTTCVSSCTNCVATATSGTVGSGNLIGNTFCLNNNVTITGNVNIVGCEVKIAPNVIITIAPTGNLNITSSHLYSCTDMWKGIIIQNGGKLTVRSSMIEDAITAVDITNNTQTSTVLNITGSTFNKNYKSIVINNYNLSIATYPFTIYGSVFTCRNIPFTPNSLVFPSAATIGATATNPGAPLSNQYINNSTYTENTPGASFLKVPYAGGKPNCAIELNNVGVTLNPQTTTPTYYEFSVGNIAGRNIFDNMNYGINATNANVTSVYNVFQNMITFGKGGSQGAIGINSTATDIANLRLNVTSAIANLASFGNQFTDCSRAINTFNIFEHIITYNDFRSTQVNSAPVSYINQRGKYGVKSITNRYRIYNVSNNTMYNLENGIIMDATFGPLAIPTIPVGNGQYAGKLNADNNTIAPQVGSNPITTQFVSNAIALSNVVSGPIVPAIPIPLIQSANNTITKVYRGIAYSNWTKTNCIVNSNNITLVVDPYIISAPPRQYGIALSGCTPASSANSVRANNVNGFSSTASNVFAIVHSQSFSSIVNCNTTTNTLDGITFAGNCPGTSFSKNTMSNHTYGFALRQSAFTGPLGATNAPTDNVWSGTWPAGKYKTATINSSGVNNPLWVKGSGGPTLNPNGSGYTNMFYTVDDYFHNTSNTAPLRYVTSNGPITFCPIIVTPTNTPPPSNFVQQLEQVALDQVTYALNQIAEARYIGKNNLLRLLKEDPTLITGSPILQTFTATSTSQTREKFANVEEQTVTGNIGAANSINASVSPTIAAESSYKDFYNVAMNYANNTLSGSDSTTIATIANGCPFTDGNVVYQARSLYNVMFDTYVVFEDNCPEGSGSRMAQYSENAANSNEVTDAVIYPNPGASAFNLALFGQKDGEVDIQVADITGKIVYQNKHQIENSMTSFNLDVTNGVYMVRVTGAANTLLIKKLVIQK